jgi:tetratricopeptide (TPR) repeat protein
MKLRPSVILALLAVLAIKAAVLFQLGHHPLLDPTGELDGAYYRHFGEMVSGGDWALSSRDSFLGQPPAPFMIAPLYIYFLGLVFKLSGNSLMAARAVQIVFGTAGVLLLALSVRRWFGERAAWIAGALAAFTGLFTFFEVVILPASLDPFLTGLDLYLIGKAADEGGTKNWALAGAALGLHALNRPHIAIVLALMTVVVAWRSKAKAAAALAITACVVIAPASIRNMRVGGEFIPIASTFGINVLDGNGPDADGTVSKVMGIIPNVSGEWVSAQMVASNALGRAATPRQTSFFFLRQAASWTLHNPGKAIALFVKKLWYTLSATFLTLNHSYVFFARELMGPLSFLIVGPALIVPLGLVGLLFARPRDRRGYWEYAAFAPLAILSVALIFVAARYRLPFQMALTGMAGGAIAWALDRAREQSWGALTVPAVSMAALTAVAVYPTRLDDGRSEELVRMGLTEIQSGHIAEGETWVQRAIARKASPGLVHVRAGQVYETLGKSGEAIAHYKQALVTDPKEPVIHFVLGRALISSGDLSGAIRELAGARVGSQQDAASRLLVIALARSNRREETNTVIHDLDPGRWNADQARQFAAAIAEAGRVDLSVAAWQRAAQLSNDSRDYERLGLAWAIVGRNDESMAALAEAVRLDPSIASVRVNYAVALATAGRIAEAKAQCEEALKIDPTYTNAQQLLAELNKK